MKVIDLVQTCNGCHSQWEFKTDDDRMCYARYRWGYLSVRVSVDPGGSVNDAVRGIEIFGRQLGDKLDGFLCWESVLELIGDINVGSVLVQNVKGGFLRAFEEVRLLEVNHAEHIKGWKCGDFPDGDILRYAHLEIEELERAPDDIDEMADSLICLLSYCVRKGWDLDKVGYAISHKLRVRFKDAGKLLGDDDAFFERLRSFEARLRSFEAPDLPDSEDDDL